MAKKSGTGEIVVKLRDGTCIVFKAQDTDADFGQLVRDAVAELGVTQYQLSKLTGVPQGAISNFLAGKDVRLSTFNKLAQAMGFQLTRNSSRAPKRT